MKNKLQNYFPMIRTREEIALEIAANPTLRNQFEALSDARRQEFLDFCSGAKGVRLLYDSFFKAVMDPERDPSRMSAFLSLLLGRQVSVVSVLPHEGGRVTPETLVIMDIIVKLEDGSITTVEVQKYGYAFPGQRAACYSADMLLRQYKQKRDQAAGEGRPMNYRSLRPVYTIVLYESSPSEFRKYPKQYIHHFRQTSDTGLELNLLEEYFFIPLDILKKNLQNEGIRNPLEAWLAFFCMDEPEWILKVAESSPRFREMYAEIYDMCRNLEGVMQMYSKELQELDRNTVQYMIDEMQVTINEKNAVIEEKDAQLSQQNAQLSQKDAQLSQKDSIITELECQLQELKRLLAKEEKPAK